MTTTLHPAHRAPSPAELDVNSEIGRPEGASLALACVLLGIVFLGGAVLALEPGQNALDSWGFSAFPDVLPWAFHGLMSDLGLFPVTAGVALVAAALILRRDRRRALACLAGPGLAVGLAELLKLIVGRRFEGALCWPSGTTTAVTAVVAVVVLVLRGRGQIVAVILGSVVVIFEVVTLVSFRWHYLSDALGGVLLGVACVLFVDALFHRLRRLRRRPDRLPHSGPT